jgi:hypothetical protein
MDEGAITSVADEIITVHTIYYCSSVTAIHTTDAAAARSINEGLQSRNETRSEIVERIMW